LGSAPTVAMLEQYVIPLLDQGADTLVLGCTHYPFVQAQIEEIVARHAGRTVTLIDTGDAVARQLERLLAASTLLRAPDGNATLGGFTTASAAALSAAFDNLLGYAGEVEEVDLP
ncbi:MAG TPA: glutamate racemase, partial [Ramlibacter sp.]|nr:glutamate racemase [Ramlibacter sp.]